MEYSERELEVLKNIHQNSCVRQRDLARIVGVSLGMINVIMKRLVKKGLLSIKKINNRNIKYAVSSEGFDTIMRRSYRYFKRTIKNIVDYKESIMKIIGNIKKQGFLGIVIIGKSDLDFIIEHCCHKQGVTLLKNNKEHEGKIFYLYAECFMPDYKNKKNIKNFLFLHRLFLGEVKSDTDITQN